MDYVDRSRIPAIHEAASRARSEYVHSLLRRFMKVFSNGKVVPKAQACHV